MIAGSAEDGEDVDEEIRMINEGQNRARRNPDDDNLSDVSVHNTQEYLARLGIINSHPNSNSSVQNENAIDMTSHRQAVPMTRIGMFDDDGANEADITNIIYAKLNDVSSERGRFLIFFSNFMAVHSRVNKIFVLKKIRITEGTRQNIRISEHFKLVNFELVSLDCN